MAHRHTRAERPRRCIPVQVLNANERTLVDASNTEYSLQCVRQQYTLSIS